MKTLVINLSQRKDRFETFKKNNPKLYEFERFSAFDGYKISYAKLLKSGFDVDHDWIDPILNTRLTKGEVGCFLSHYTIWMKCIQRNESVMVLEDDAIMTDYFDMKEIESLPYDFIYLGWKEMEKSEPIDDKLVSPVYPYWGLAYVIRPEAAKILVNDCIKKSIMPVDEYLPTMMSQLKVAAFSTNVFNPRPRSEAKSNILAESRYDYFIDFETIHTVTVATDESKADRLLSSVRSQSSKIINLGQGVDWQGGTMEGQGGGHKINLVKEYIQDKKDSDILIFLDGYDTFLSDSIEEITYRFMEFSERAIFSSERFCWPDTRLSQALESKNKMSTPYSYLNSGMYIGRIGELKKIFAPPIQNNEDDQLYVQKQYLTGAYDMSCDYEGYMFTTHESQVMMKNGQLYNPVTGCYTCAYHGNGGEKEKQWMNELYQTFYAKSSISYIPTKKYDILSDDILLIDLMSEDMCQNMISLAEEKQFHIMEGDKVPAQELRIKELGLWRELEKHWNQIVYEIVWEYWNPCHMWGLRDAFIIKYEMDKQRELRLHNDASLVTGSIKLNDDYEGGVLEFPRQKINNKDIPVGKCILFPGQVTHGHLSTQLTKGTKYSLTIWSSRYKGDIN